MIRQASLDNLDTRLIELPRVDGRRPNTELARQLGVAEGTVRKRNDRLLRGRITQIGVLADPLRLGHQADAIMAIQVSPPPLTEGKP